MDMNKTFFLKNKERAPKWVLFDANNKVVGRLATQIAIMLRGKDLAQFTPHADAELNIVVINSDKLVFTGNNKLDQKTYERYTGYIGNKKIFTARQMMQKDSTHVLALAVRGMLPKHSALARGLLKKLKVYKGAEHPHIAQIPAAK